MPPERMKGYIVTLPYICYFRRSVPTSHSTALGFPRRRKCREWPGLDKLREDEMAEVNRKRLLELLQNIPGNNVCADCGCEGPEWASYNIGVFLCTGCAVIHRNLGSHISKVKSLYLDNWEQFHLQTMENVGNEKAKATYEVHVPFCYRRPCYSDVQVLKEQWIRAKYERLEFVYPERQKYVKNVMEGYLLKRGKDDGRFQLRKFVLNEREGTLKYYIKEHKDPKAILRISELNAMFCPDKIGNPNGLQLTYFKDGSTRNIFVYAEDGKDIVDWYMAIRSAKLGHLQVAFPGASEKELLCRLMHDFLKEGWLWKTGPRNGDAYKRRWFSLDDRKLMYLVDQLDAFPKGEIFLGYHTDGYAVRLGVPPGQKELGCGFTLRTPERSYLLGAENEEERTEWMNALQQVINRPLTPQDNTMAATLIRKRATFGPSLHILKSR